MSTQRSFQPVVAIDSSARPMQFPSLTNALPPLSPAPGLLAWGGDLCEERLILAYSRGIFPWFSEGDPILWWSPDPRMVLFPQAFKLSRSLRRTLRRFLLTEGCELRIDTAFAQVIKACSSARRKGQKGTWIVPSMIDAYIRLHRFGVAHSFETWAHGQLVGGLYGVALGSMFYGESMFAFQTDASKLALCALVAYARYYQIQLIDCQQETQHLASLGAKTMPRAEFETAILQAQRKPAPPWCAGVPDNTIWSTLLP